MFTILSTADFNTTNWSGGQTTELYIYPKNSTYSERNFIFRISIATTEQQNSTFTPLPQTLRFLSILDGQMQICHKNDSGEVLATKTLNPYQIDEFSGDWHTTSQGKVKDFNLMLKSQNNTKTNGKLLFKQFKQDFKLDLTQANFVFVYAIDTNLAITANQLNNSKLELKAGELLIIDQITDQTDFCLANLNDEQQYAKIFYGYIVTTQLNSDSN